MPTQKEKEPRRALSQLLDINEAITLFFKSNAPAFDCIERDKEPQPLNSAIAEKGAHE